MRVSRGAGRRAPGSGRAGRAAVSRGAVVAAVLLAAAGLAACTQDEPDTDVTAPTFVDSTGPSEPPSPSADPSASAEPSAEPTVAAPPLPELATQQTPEGAVAFTQWWFETLNYATATGDTAGLRAASDPGCEFCDNLAGELESLYGGGGRREGGLTEVVISPPGALQNLGINLAVVVDLQPAVDLDGSGVEVETFAAETGLPLVASVLLAEPGWRMGAVAE